MVRPNDALAAFLVTLAAFLVPLAGVLVALTGADFLAATFLVVLVIFLAAALTALGCEGVVFFWHIGLFVFVLS
jgi:hypothetical protein